MYKNCSACSAFCFPVKRKNFAGEIRQQDEITEKMRIQANALKVTLCFSQHSKIFVKLL